MTEENTSVENLIKNSLTKQGVEKSDFANLKYIVYAMLVVLFFIVLGMVINSWTERKVAFVSLTKQVMEQNLRIKLLEESIESMQDSCVIIK